MTRKRAHRKNRSAPKQDDLLALLSASDSIQNLLDRVVEHLATRWGVAWCSVFLFDETTQRLSLHAAHGSPTKLVGRLSFALGEGLVGLALSGRKPFYTEQAGKETGFQDDDRIPVRSFDTMLVLPVLRGEERIGALVMQRPTGTPFTEAEINGLRSTAAQMAGSLENARALLLITRKNQERDNGTLEITEQRLFRGTPVSQGVAIGTTRILARTRAAHMLAACQKGLSKSPARRSLEEAVEHTIRQLEHYQETLGQRLPEAASLLFEAHLLMLKDDSFMGKIRRRMDSGMPPVQAIASTAGEFIAFFESSRHEYLREKARDVEDLALRLLENIQCEAVLEDSTQEADVVVTAELLPSDILRVAQGNVQGIVLVGGGSTAHVTLLAQSLHIPMVITQADELLRVRDAEPVIVDCASGNIILHPRDAIRATYEERRRQIEIRVHEKVRETSHTKDGCRIHLMANINLLAELDLAVTMNAEGVGLYRTEFPFLMRQALPTEDEQLAVYERLLAAMPKKTVVFRTLDTGGDKILSYFDQAREANPSLGLRSTRFTLRYPYIFDQQLRAILRAVQLQQHRHVKVMFPMIGSVEEFQAAVRRVETCLAQVGTQGFAGSPIRPELGTMVELPALVHLADAIAREAAFLSIGTNDFIQYMLGVDRTNSQVADYYIPHHPAVLHGLAQVVQAGREAGKEVSICGEMGRDPRYIPFFLGIGVRVFSLEPGHIGQVQNWVEQLTVPEAETYARTLLQANRVAAIEEEIRRMMARLGCEA